MVDFEPEHLQPLIVKCPKCQRADRLQVVGKAWARLGATGLDPVEPLEWDGDCAMRCEACGEGGFAYDFQVVEDEEVAP